MFPGFVHARDLFDWGTKTTANVNFCVKFDGNWVGVWIQDSPYQPVIDRNNFAFSSANQQTRCHKISMNIGAASKYVEIKGLTMIHGGQLEFYACENENNDSPQCDDAAKRRYIPATKSQS